eukprot:s49_g15.t1
MWEMQPAKQLEEANHVYACSSACCFGGEREKWTGLLVNSQEVARAVHQPTCEGHENLRSYEVEELPDGTLYYPTEEEAAYPLGWCAAYAEGLKKDLVQNEFMERTYKEGRLQWLQKELSQSTERLQQGELQRRASVTLFELEEEMKRGWEKDHLAAMARKASIRGSDLRLHVTVDEVPQELPYPAFRWLWQEKLSYAWQAPEHINYLEIRAFIAMLKRRVRQTPTRYLHIVDSAVTRGAVAKGRSSSPQVNKLLRKIGALCLVSETRQDGMPSRPHLKFAGLQERTLDAYGKALQQFLIYAKRERVRLDSPSQLDKHLAEYVNILFQEGESLSAAGHLLSSIKRFVPECKLQLPRATQFHRNWQRLHVPVRATPFTHDLVEALAALCLSINKAPLALLLMCGFRAFLRTNDQIQWIHLLVNHRPQCINLVLPFSKTSNGNPQVLRIEDPLICRLVARVRPASNSKALLWPYALRRFHRTWKQLLRCLKFSAADYSPYGIRRGGATHFFLTCGNLDATVQRGRWSNSRVARLYIDDGAPALAEMAWTPPQKKAVRKWAKIFGRFDKPLRKNHGKLGLKWEQRPFDASVNQYDAYGRPKSPYPGNPALLLHDGYRQKAVNSTLACQSGGCQATADLSFSQEGDLQNCKLSVKVKPTDFGVNKVVEFITVNDRTVSLNCQPPSSDCSEANQLTSLFDCVYEIDVQHLLSNRSLQLSAKISDGVNKSDCAYKGNLLYAVPQVTCLVGPVPGVAMNISDVLARPVATPIKLSLIPDAMAVSMGEATKEELQEKAEVRIQEQLGEKEREIMILKQENQFQREELVLRQQELQAAGTDGWEQKEKQLLEQVAGKDAEILKLQKESQLQKEDLFRQEQTMQQIRQEERAENQETAKTVERLQEQLVEKDILIDALKEENRMKHEEVLRKDAEMKETLHEEQLRNQDIRDMMIFEETEKTTNFFAIKEKDLQEKLADSDLQITSLRKENKSKDEEILCKDQALQEIQEECRRKQEQLSQKDLQIEMLRESQLQHEEQLIHRDQETQEMLREERAHQEDELLKLQAELEVMKEDRQTLDDLSSQKAELQVLLAEEQRRNEELRAEMMRCSEQNTAQVFEKEAQFELELAEVSDQKISLEAQLAALTQRLDEEQAERIRQGARAESLEKDLQALRKLRVEEQEAKREIDSQNGWHRLVRSAATQAELSSLRTSQRCFHSEVLKLRAEKTQEKSQLADLTTCVDENEKLLSANRELSLSLQQFKQENEQLQIDNRSLLESVALFEADLEKVSDRHAQLIGHVNKKQKIRYTVKLKEECSQLRLDLNKARHRLNQLEGSRRSDSLFGALASLGYEGQLHARGEGSSQESKRLQECALERVNADFRHLVSLVQSAIGDGVDRSTADFAELLQALRNRSKEGHAGRHAGRIPRKQISPMQSPAKSVEEMEDKSMIPTSTTSCASAANWILEDQENMASAQNCEDSDQLREAKKVLLQINQCIGSGRKLYGQPVSDSWGFFQVLQRKGAIQQKDVAQGLKRLDITLSQTAMDALIHALDAGYLGSCWTDPSSPGSC